MLKGERINKTIILLMIVVLGMVCLVGCRDSGVTKNPNLEDMPEVRDGYSKDVWEKCYEAYSIISRTFVEETELTDKEIEFVGKYIEWADNKKDINEKEAELIDDTANLIASMVALETMNIKAKQGVDIPKTDIYTTQIEVSDYCISLLKFYNQFN